MKRGGCYLLEVTAALVGTRVNGDRAAGAAAAAEVVRRGGGSMSVEVAEAACGTQEWVQ